MAFTSDSVQVFLAALDHGSFSAAARALSRVPSAVSMTIAHLEAELAVQLFDRSGREPRPTAAARALEPQARLLAGQLQQLNAQALALTQGLEERLTLAIAPELLASRWTAPLAALAHEYPLLQVEVLTAPQVDALALLHSGRAQLALVFERPSIDGREGFQEVGTETLVAVMAHSYTMAARPAWDSVLWILYVLGNACVLGPATFLLLSALAAGGPGDQPAERAAGAGAPAGLAALAGAALNALAALAFAIFLQLSAGSFADVGYYFDPTHPTRAMADAAATVGAQ